jgi:hypothetical protein
VCLINTLTCNPTAPRAPAPALAAHARSLYRIRASVPGKRPVLASLRAACVAEHLLGLQYVLSVSAAGELVGVQALVPGGATSCSAQRALEALDRLPGRALAQVRGWQARGHKRLACFGTRNASMGEVCLFDSLAQF